MQQFQYTNTDSYSSQYDEGLRRYFLNIYSLMSFALCVTAFSSFTVLSIPFFTHAIFHITPHGQVIGFSGLGTLIVFAPVIISLLFTFNIHKIEVNTARILFLVYAALIGISLSSLGLIYTGTSLIKTFLVCASNFGAMSIYGYTTQRNLSSLQSFLYMGLVGLIIALIINAFMQSLAIEFALSFIGVIIFTCLIAYDTQKLRRLYLNSTSLHKIEIIAALTLYLDFINLFVYLLQFLARKKNE